MSAISKDFGSNFEICKPVGNFEADESDASFLLSNPCAQLLQVDTGMWNASKHDYDKFFQAYETHLLKLR